MSHTSAMQPDIGARFERLLGAQLALSDRPTLERYAIESVPPAIVLRLENVEQIAAVLRIANEENWSVVPFGGGTRQHVGRTPEAVDLVLAMDRMNEIENYEPGDLTISVQAGARVNEVTKACSAHRQLLPIDTLPGSSVGGSLATAVSGPLRAGFGGLRDFCIGISFISGDGVSGRGGGRVVKNVAGYDLMKLMIGSFGTFGVITSANFKLFPLPTETLTCVCQFGSAAQLFAVRDWLLKSPLSPISCEMIGPEAAEYLEDTEPRDPDDWAPEVPGKDLARPWQLAVRFSGSGRALARCRREVSSWAARELSASEEGTFWRRLAEFEQRVSKRHRNAMVFQLEVPIAESQASLDAARSAANDYNFVAAVIGRATLGSFVVAFLPLAIDPPAVTQFAGAASALRARLSRECSAVVLRCPPEAKQHFDVWGSTPTDTLLMRKIKHALDPKGILNRGRFLVG
ncbi:MAG TPA: FAD-binding oxidoreductase [Terriglobales bacterium]|nr:FAD-binding oxidoreductase [Terriglobales bacterium]